MISLPDHAVRHSRAQLLRDAVHTSLAATFTPTRRVLFWDDKAVVVPGFQVRDPRHRPICPATRRRSAGPARPCARYARAVPPDARRSGLAGRYRRRTPQDSLFTL